MHSTEDKPVGRLGGVTWEISDDKMTFTFHIDIQTQKWSDGQPVNAEDVQFYYDVMMANSEEPDQRFGASIVSRFNRPRGGR